MPTNISERTEPSSHTKRKNGAGSHTLERRLAAYSLAAATAGVAATALAQDAAHQTIQYTPADIFFVGQARWNQPVIQLDLNHEGIVDLSIYAGGSGYSLGTAHISYYRGGAWWKGANGVGLRRALTKGMWIGPGEDFIGGNSLLQDRFIHRNVHTYGQNHCWGPFAAPGYSKPQLYLGVAFSIDGQTHYGWVRMGELDCGGGGVLGYITGYAYNTIPNAPIQAGQIRSGEAQANKADLKGTLGMLALGSLGRQ